MNEQSLYEKQQAVKAAFDAKAVEKGQEETKVEEIVLEMNRLQGEYRLLDSLREELKKAVTTPAGDPTSTLPADPLGRSKKEAKNGSK